MKPMRPPLRAGLPDPLLSLLGARWTMGAPVAGVAWFGDAPAAGFALADGTLAIARATWEGAAAVRPRDGGGVELVPAAEAAPPVSRVGAHQGPCVAVVADGGGGVLTAGGDGRVVGIGSGGKLKAVARFGATAVEHLAAAAGAWACAVASEVHRHGAAPGRLDRDTPVTALAFDPAARDLAIGHQDGVTLWSADDTRVLLPLSGAPGALTWSGDGRLLAAGSDAGEIWLWRVADGTVLVQAECAAPPLSLSFSAPGGFLAASGDTRVACWPLGAGERRVCGVPSSAGVSRLACHPTRLLVAAGYDNGAVLLCQPDSADILFVREAGGGAVTALAWSPDGEHLAIGVAGGEIGVAAFPALLFRTATATGRPAR